MRRTAFVLAALTVVGLLSTACADGRGEVEAGDCFGQGTAARFDWDTEVSCEKPHTVEVFHVHDASATPLGQFARADLDEQGSPARQQYLRLLTDVCEPKWSDYTGYDELASPLVPGAVVLPALNGDMALEATAQPEWEAGNRIVVCYQVLGRPGTRNEAPISVQRPVLQTLTTDPGAVPIELRDCALAPVGGQGEQPVPCTAQHDREYLGHLDLAQFLGGSVPELDQPFLDQFDTVTASEQDWAVLDGLCERVFGQLIGENQDASLFAQVYTDESWGWADGGFYHAACFAQTAPQAGSVLD